MHKLLVFAGVFLFGCSAECQTVDFFAGASINRFHYLSRDNISGSHTSNVGFTIGSEIDSIKFDWLYVAFRLQFENYQGALRASIGSPGGGQSIQARVNKSLLSVSAFPINVGKRHLKLKVGFMYSRLLYETFSGTMNYWQMGKPPESFSLNEKYERFNARSYFGINSKLSYEVILSKGFSLIPEVSYYKGISNEFSQFPYTRSSRFYFSIGIGKQVNKR
jgi:hypothetical protein